MYDNAAIKRCPAQYRKKKKKNINVMMHKLKETNWNEILASEDVNDMYDTFTAKLKNIQLYIIQLVLLLSLNISLLGKRQTSHG